MQKLFAGLYHGLIGLFTNKTSEYSTYLLEIFTPVSLLTVVLAVALVLLYYYVFNGPTAFLGRTWNGAGQWLLTLLLAAGLAVWLAYSFSLRHGVEANQYLGYFMVVNLLLAALWFFLFSVLLKRKSPHASTTPLAWPTFAR